MCNSRFATVVRPVKVGLAVFTALFLSTCLSEASVITTSTNFDVPFVDSVNFGLLLNAFNPSIGILDSVQFLINVDVSTSTQVINNTFSLVPPGIVLPSPAQGTISSQTILTMNTDGLPLFVTPVISPTFPVFIPPGGVTSARTVAVTAISKGVPAFEVDAFSKVGFAPITFSLQQLTRSNIVPIGPQPIIGAVTVGPTASEFKGSLTTIYEYEPFVGSSPSPEPSAAYAVSVGLVAFFIARRFKRWSS